MKNKMVIPTIIFLIIVLFVRGTDAPLVACVEPYTTDFYINGEYASKPAFEENQSIVLNPNSFIVISSHWHDDDTPSACANQQDTRFLFSNITDGFGWTSIGSNTPIYTTETNIRSLIENHPSTNHTNYLINNLTISCGLEGKDYRLRSSTRVSTTSTWYESNSIIINCTNSIYDGEGDWEIPCDKNYVTSNITDLKGNNLILKNNGSLTINYDINNVGSIIAGGNCKLISNGKRRITSI